MPMSAAGSVSCHIGEALAGQSMVFKWREDENGGGGAGLALQTLFQFKPICYLGKTGG